MSTSEALSYLIEAGHVGSWRQDPETRKFDIAGPGMFWSGLTANRLIDHAGYCQRQDDFSRAVRS